MKLNVRKQAHSLDEALGITEERRMHLVDVVCEQVEIVKQKAGVTLLSQHYKALAENCTTLEEYTMCMHAFLFALSKYGCLSTDERIRN